MSKSSNSKKIQILNNQELQRYIEELDEDVKLSVNNLREKALMCTSIRAKWLSYFFKERENLERIKNAKAKILKDKLSNSTISDSVLKLKNEQNIAKNDENIQKLNNLNEITQNNLDFIERALDVLANFSFNIKNSIECMKLERS